MLESAVGFSKDSPLKSQYCTLQHIVMPRHLSPLPHCGRAMQSRGNLSTSCSRSEPIRHKSVYTGHSHGRRWIQRSACNLSWLYQAKESTFIRWLEESASISLCLCLSWHIQTTQETERIKIGRPF